MRYFVFSLLIIGTTPASAGDSWEVMNVIEEQAMDAVNDYFLAHFIHTGDQRQAKQLRADSLARLKRAQGLGPAFLYRLLKDLSSKILWEEQDAVFEEMLLLVPEIIKNSDFDRQRSKPAGREVISRLRSLRITLEEPIHPSNRRLQVFLKIWRDFKLWSPKDDNFVDRLEESCAFPPEQISEFRTAIHNKPNNVVSINCERKIKGGTTSN